jgi:hypothetical protein
MDTRTIDWVKERAACSAALMFEKLKQDIVTDVDVRNDLRPKDQVFGVAYGFRVLESNSSFRVLREGNRGISASVIFSLENDDITVKNQDDAVLFTAKVTLNDEGICVFKIKGEERHPWQMRKMALEDIFFSGL